MKKLSCKVKVKNVQKAQGMVEFALALPILMLLLLGIFAFGHLFFVYSLVVSASREASRFGAAVGETDSGLLRYQDCDGILAAAVRVGAVAGVKADDIHITYDKGPQDPASLGDCPAGGAGPVVDLGDRIDVDVLVHYKPIVPLVNLPEIPLHATTSRTIVKSVSVGVAPDATMPFAVTNTTLSQDPAGASVVGEEVSFYVDVTAVDKKGNWVDPPANTDSIEVTDSEGNVCRLDAPGGYCYFTYYTAGDKTIIARYEGNYNDPLYEPSETDEFIHHVNPAPTSLCCFFHTPNPSLNGAAVQVKVHVNPAPLVARPHGPTGLVRFEELDGGTVIGLGCDGALDDNFDAACTMYLTPPRSGSWVDIRAYYMGDPNYNPSAAITDRHRVDNGATVTPQPSPTVIATPTITSTPVICPAAPNGMNFGVQQDGFTLSIKNNDGSHSVTALSVSLTWPETGAPKLQEIHFATTTGTGCNGGGSDCLWNSGSGLNPPSATANSADNKWNSTLAQMNAGETKEMRLVFNHNLANGPYILTVSFNNGCSLTVNSSRLR